jgi:hypothetical protein
MAMTDEMIESKENKYKSGKIYKIFSTKEPDLIYIGSTTSHLNQRMSRHRSAYKQYKNGNGTKLTIYDIFDKHGVETCGIQLIEYYDCENKEQLDRREYYYISKNSCVNSICINKPKITRKKVIEEPSKYTNILHDILAIEVKLPIVLPSTRSFLKNRNLTSRHHFGSFGSIMTKPVIKSEEMLFNELKEYIAAAEHQYLIDTNKIPNFPQTNIKEMMIYHEHQEKLKKFKELENYIEIAKNQNKASNSKKTMEDLINEEYNNRQILKFIEIQNCIKKYL